MVRFNLNAICAVAVSILLFSAAMIHGRSGQQPVGEAQTEPGVAATLQGVVRDSANRPVAGAAVSLRAGDAPILTVHTDSAGAYLFSTVRPGTYILRAGKAGYDQVDSSPFVLATKETRMIRLTLNVSRVAAAGASSAASAFARSGSVTRRESRAVDRRRRKLKYAAVNIARHAL